MDWPHTDLCAPTRSIWTPNEAFSNLKMGGITYDPPFIKSRNLSKPESIRNDIFWQFVLQTRLWKRFWFLKIRQRNQNLHPQIHLKRIDSRFQWNFTGPSPCKFKQSEMVRKNWPESWQIHCQNDFKSFVFLPKPHPDLRAPMDFQTFLLPCKRKGMPLPNWVSLVNVKLISTTFASNLACSQIFSLLLFSY